MYVRDELRINQNEGDISQSLGLDSKSLKTGTRKGKLLHIF